MGILGRLMILVLLGLTPAVGVQALNEWLLYRDLDEDLHGVAQRSADIYNTELDQIARGLRRLLGALEQLPAIRSMDGLPCTSLLRGLASRYPQDVVLAVADLGGHVRCSSRPPATPVSIPDRHFLAAAARGFTVGTFTTGPLDGAPALPFGRPITGSNGETLGVIVAYLPLQWLASDLERPALGAGQSLTVADRDGVVLAHLPAGELAAGARLPPRLLTTMHDPAPGVMEQNDLRGRRTIFGSFAEAPHVPRAGVRKISRGREIFSIALSSPCSIIAAGCSHDRTLPSGARALLAWRSPHPARRPRAAGRGAAR